IPTDLISTDTLETIEKIENALPQVKGLDISDKEFDELSQLAVESFQDLSNLGMQVDSRFSAEIFAVASTMLGHAITAKTSKINKKLKMIDLQLKKAELDRKLSIAAAKEENVPKENLGVGHVLDRNELLKQLIKQTDSVKNNNQDK
ncbi:hypothetical protein EBS02_08060, partial [bacterium]|nr:hypothetical protein [bacterium]